MKQNIKNVEFEIAYNGIIGLQTALALALQAGLSPEMIVEKMAVNPRKVLDLDLPIISVGRKANCVMFDVNGEWSYDSQTNYSMSNNSPLFGQTLRGKVNMVINNNKKFLS